MSFASRLTGDYMDPAIFVGLAIFVYLLSTLVYALRWKIVLRAFGRDVPYLELLKANLSGLFVNNITPMARAGGETIRVLWINRHCKVPMSLLGASIAYERASEAIVIFLLFVIAVSSATSIHWLLVLSLLALAILFYYRLDLVFDLVERLSKERFSPEVRRAALKKLRAGPTLLVTVLLSATVWILDILRFYLELLAVGVVLPVLKVVAISVTNFLIGILSITPGGLGIVEGGLTGILVGMGLSLSDALKVVAIERSISYGLAIAIGATVTFVFGGRDVWKALKSRLRRTGSRRA